MDNNPWQRAQAQLKSAASHIELDPLTLLRLENPDRIVEVSLPMKMDDGSVQSV